MIHLLHQCVTWCHMCSFVLLMKRNCLLRVIRSFRLRIAAAEIPQLIGFGGSGVHVAVPQRLEEELTVVPWCDKSWQVVAPVTFCHVDFPGFSIISLQHFVATFAGNSKPITETWSVVFCTFSMFQVPGCTRWWSKGVQGGWGVCSLRTTWWIMSLPPPEQRKEPTPSGFNGSAPYMLRCATGKRWKRDRRAIWWLSLCNA